MVYKTASQKILIWLFIITFTITVISGGNYWKMWSVLPTTFFMLWLAGKSTVPHGPLKKVFLPPTLFECVPTIIIINVLSISY